MVKRKTTTIILKECHTNYEMRKRKYVEKENEKNQLAPSIWNQKKRKNIYFRYTHRRGLILT